MIIERIQVEEGFLDGLDLSLSAGLNVLIGPRGAGKTSVIELIRFCLGSQALTDKSAHAAREHALSILGAGRVTVTMLGQNERFTVSRSAENWTKPTSLKWVPPLILSQNEIEAVGLHAMGRLKLIDSIRPANKGTDAPDEETNLLAHIRSQSQERLAVSAEIQTVRQQICVLAEQLKVGAELKQQHAEVLQSLAKATKETERLNQLGAALASLSVSGTVYERAQKTLTDWKERLSGLRTESMTLEAWPPSANSPDALTEVRTLLTESRGKVVSAIADADRALQALRKLREENNASSLKLEDEARTLRRLLDGLRQGAGEIAKKLAVLQEKQSQFEALHNLEKTNLQKLESIQAKRRELLDSLEEIRSQRFEERSQLISQLNRELSPRIKLKIERAGQTTEYASALVAALRGSGLRFNEVAPIIADQMSPREFVEAVEAEDIELLASVTGISASRASKIIERINEEGAEGILTAPIEDGVTFSLLDGKEYKTSEQLSTGQRCTVVLPLLLRQHRPALIVDQPEDHLDNAFVVETLVNAIMRRKTEGQLIFSTHNANIPVLGEAEKIILMGSDGTRGFVKHAGALDDAVSVQAITSVMEGGIEAFDRRAKFYHSGSSNGA